MGEGEDLTDVILRAQDNCPLAWALLLKRFGPLVETVARRCGVADHEVADVSQTVWLQLARRIGSIEEPERLRAWLVTTSRREAIRTAGRSRRQPPALIDDATPCPQPRAEDVVIGRERHRQLRAAVGHLPLDCRELLSLFLEEPAPTYQEVATTLRIATNGVGPRRSRCLKLLRSAAL
jgi:RNA polymerase sigma factor (sigma-70 family)